MKTGSGSAPRALKEPGGDAWLEITLPQKQNVGRVHVYAPSSTCGMPGLRAFKVQAFDYDKQDWRAVGEVADSEEAWVFHFVFPRHQHRPREDRHHGPEQRLQTGRQEALHGHEAAGLGGGGYPGDCQCPGRGK